LIGGEWFIEVNSKFEINIDQEEIKFEEKNYIAIWLEWTYA